MKEEMDTLKEIETFELAQLPPNKCMCYQNRQNQKEIYEARLLYKVFFFQKSYIDYQ